MPALDVHTIGAGGGSIAAIDAGGALVVGPQSAGADPGPGLLRAGRRPARRSPTPTWWPAASRSDGLPGWAGSTSAAARRPSSRAGRHRRGRHRGGGSRHGAGRPGGVGAAGRRPGRAGPGGVRRRRPAARLRPGRSARDAGGGRAAPGRGALGRRAAGRAPPGRPGPLLAAIRPTTTGAEAAAAALGRARPPAAGRPAAAGVEVGARLPLRRPEPRAHRAERSAASRPSTPGATASPWRTSPSRWWPSGPRPAGRRPSTWPAWPPTGPAGPGRGPGGASPSRTAPSGWRAGWRARRREPSGPGCSTDEPRLQRWIRPPCRC